MPRLPKDRQRFRLDLGAYDRGAREGCDSPGDEELPLHSTLHSHHSISLGALQRGWDKFTILRRQWHSQKGHYRAKQESALAEFHDPPSVARGLTPQSYHKTKCDAECAVPA